MPRYLNFETSSICLFVQEYVDTCSSLPCHQNSCRLLFIESNFVLECPVYDFLQIRIWEVFWFKNGFPLSMASRSSGNSITFAWVMYYKLSREFYWIFQNPDRQQNPWGQTFITIFSTLILLVVMAALLALKYLFARLYRFLGHWNSPSVLKMLNYLAALKAGWTSRLTSITYYLSLKLCSTYIYITIKASLWHKTHIFSLTQNTDSKNKC